MSSLAIAASNNAWEASASGYSRDGRCKQALVPAAGFAVLIASALTPAYGAPIINPATHFAQYSYDATSQQNVPLWQFDILREKNLESIEHMASFERNWNGAGALAFTDDALDLFKKVVRSLSRQPEIAPTGRNSLYLQYAKDDGSILAFEVSLEGFEMVQITKGDFEHANPLHLSVDDFSDLNERVESFYG